MQAAGTLSGGEEARAPGAAVTSASALPVRIGKYAVLAEVGAGTLVRSFRASDQGTGRPVLLKLLTNKDSQRLVELFRREVGYAARIHHPNLITIYELGDHAGLPFAASQDVEGRDLSSALREQSRLSLLEKVTIMWQIAEGLRVAHRGGLSYVGIRPSGITLTSSGSAVIHDFSIVRPIGDEQDEDLSYAAPEELQADVQPDALCDTFSFGAIYHELLTGARPLRDGGAAALRESAPECPEGLERLVRRALDTNRARRYQSMDDLQDDAEPVFCELKRLRAAALLAETRRLQAAGQIDEAQDIARGVLQLDPANRKASGLHARLRAEQRRRMLQDRLKSLFGEAEIEASARHFARAVEILHTAAQLPGAPPEAGQRLEEMCGRLERSQNAAQLVAEARQLLVEGNLADAQAKAVEARSLDPGLRDPDELLAAIAAADECRRREARIQQELSLAQFFIAEEAYDSAISLLLSLRAEFPNFPAIELCLGNVEARTLLAQERFSDAVAKLTSLLERFPSDGATRDLLQQAGEKLKRAEAIANVKTACATLLPEKQFEKALGIINGALAAYDADPALTALHREVEEEYKAFRISTATRQALDEAEWLLQQDRPHLAAKFLREKAAELPGQTEIAERLEAIERMIPEWETGRFTQDCLARAAAMEQSEQWAVALTLIEQGLETSPGSPELLAAAERLQNRRREEESRKKLARRLDAIDQKIGAAAWIDALSLIESALSEFPAEPELERRLQQARAGRRRAESDAAAAEARQYLFDGEPEKAEEVLRKSMESLSGDPALESLWEELQAGKRYREQCRAAQVLFARRQFGEAEEILAPLAAQGRPEAQALLEAVQAARAAAEEADFYRQGREQALNLIIQSQFADAAAMIRKLLRVFPGDPVLERDLQTAEAGLQPPETDFADAPLPEPVEPPEQLLDEPAPVFFPPAAQEKEFVGRRRFLPYVLWPALGASILIFLTSTGGTIWKLFRHEAHAEAERSGAPPAKQPSSPAASLRVEPASPPEAQSSTGAHQTAPPAIVQPKPISTPAPVLTSWAAQRHLSGVVTLEATVGPRGTVMQISVIKGDPVLVAAARTAVWKWRYEPGTRNGRPVVMKVPVRIQFMN
jgi:serine/threonine-protein kinase